MNNANPSLRMPNITHNRDHTLCDQMDDFLHPTRNDETFLNTGDNHLVLVQSSVRTYCEYRLLHRHALCDALLDPELCSHQNTWLNIRNLVPTKPQSTGNDKFKTQLSTETLTLVTINIEGFHGNQVYLQTLANRADILLFSIKCSYLLWIQIATPPCPLWRIIGSWTMQSSKHLVKHT
jgi:hypothetical protein